MIDDFVVRIIITNYIIDLFVYKVWLLSNSLAAYFSFMEVQLTTKWENGVKT